MSLPSRSKKRMLTQSMVIDSANCSKIFVIRCMRTPSVTSEAMLTPFTATQHGPGDRLESRRSSTCPLGTLPIFQPHAARLPWCAAIAFLVYQLTIQAMQVTRWKILHPPCKVKGRLPTHSSFRSSGTTTLQLVSQPEHPKPRRCPGALTSFRRSLSRPSTMITIFVKTRGLVPYKDTFSDWRITLVLSPVFSPSKAKEFVDIRIPSHYYRRQCSVFICI